MKPIAVLAAALAIALTGVVGDAVGNGQTTNAITFGGFPGPYTFQRASSVNYNDGNPTCPLEEVATDDGPLAPLTGEMHYILRGPIKLKQFAVYQPSEVSNSNKKKRSLRETPTERRHRFKQHVHKHGHHARGYGQEVTALVYGQVVHFEDTWDPPTGSSNSPGAPASLTSSEAGGDGKPVTAIINGVTVTFANNWDSTVLRSEYSAVTESYLPQSAENPASTTAVSSTTEAPSTIAEAVTTVMASTTTVQVFAAQTLSEVNSGRTTYSSPISVICNSCESSTADQVLAPSVATQSQSVIVQSASSSIVSAPTSIESSAPSPGSWSRAAYFDAASQTAEDIAFTSNNNMTIEQFGFLPGWVASNGKDKADGPSLLGTTGFISDNYEVLVHSSSMCSEDDTQGGCSVVTPGTIAHHGWSGNRIVLIEYMMPQSTCGSDCANHIVGDSDNTNLPAIWSLASSTVNIGQYGFSWSDECTGWDKGAGEFDIHEILPGNEPVSVGYASLHMDNHYGGTPPQGFVRPDIPGQSMKLAVVLSGSTLHIQVLDAGTPFGEGLDADTVQGWTQGSGGGKLGGAAVDKAALAGGAAPAYAADVALATFDVLLG